MVFAARLTQRGHAIHSMDDLMALYEKAYTADTVKRIASLPHPAVQKFSVITMAVVGASRRFLVQITRHQNEVKFISASLQYSNYAGQADFVVPYEILTASQWVHDFYLKKCRAAMEHYADIGACGISRDAAGYLAPQSLRNVLVISATPYQWKHMIGQRTCRRNTDETRFVSARSLPAPSASGRAVGKKICPAAARARKGRCLLPCCVRTIPRHWKEAASENQDH